MSRNGTAQARARTHTRHAGTQTSTHTQHAGKHTHTHTHTRGEGREGGRQGGRKEGGKAKVVVAVEMVVPAAMVRVAMPVVGVVLILVYLMMV